MNHDMWAPVHHSQQIQWTNYPCKGLRAFRNAILAQHETCGEGASLLKFLPVHASLCDSFINSPVLVQEAMSLDNLDNTWPGNVNMDVHYSTSWTLCGFRYGGIELTYLRSPFHTACIDANFLGTKSSESGFCNFRCFRKADFFVSSDLECFSVCIDTVRISNNVRLQVSNF